MTKVERPIVYSTHPLHPNAAELLDGVAKLAIATDLEPDTLAREARSADMVIVRANLPEALFAGAKKLKAAIRQILERDLKSVVFLDLLRS